MSKSKSYLNQRRSSFGYALQGLWLFLRTQPHAILHALAAVAAIGAGILLNLNRFEWLFVSSAIAAVFMAEAFNTAIEFLTNATAPGHHPVAGKAKDIAAGGVLVAAIYAGMVAALVFGWRLWVLYSSM